MAAIQRFKTTLTEDFSSLYSRTQQGYTRWNYRTNLISPIIVTPPTQTVIINNGQVDEEKKDKKRETNNKLLSVIGVAAASFIGTYLFAKDNYVRYLRSTINDDIQSMWKDGAADDQVWQKIRNITEKYNNWRQVYLSNAMPRFYSKLVLILSSLVFFGGMYTNKEKFILGGVAGMTLGGCALLWTWLTRRSTEANRFFELVSVTNQ
jgi:hypothetical protein